MQTIDFMVREYIRKGFRPIPLFGVKDGRCACGNDTCKPRDAGKHCPPEVEQHWKDGRSFPPACFSEGDNVALAMGKQHGGTDGDWLVCIDADGSPDWGRFGRLPPTLEAKSPRGSHRIFRVAAEEPLGNWVDIFRTKPNGAFDLRYARGRIVVEPSQGASGAYRWTRMADPERLPQAALDAIYGARRSFGLPVLRRWQRDGKAP